MSEHLVDGENILKIIQKLVLGTKRYFWHLLLAINKNIHKKKSKILLRKGKPGNPNGPEVRYRLHQDLTMLAFLVADHCKVMSLRNCTKSFDGSVK